MRKLWTVRGRRDVVPRMVGITEPCVVDLRNVRRADPDDINNVYAHSTIQRALTLAYKVISPVISL